MIKKDVIIIGAGAAGLMCAIEAGKRHRSVLVLEHAEKIGKKILISGGGRCNFTNVHVQPENFISQNPHFCKSALVKYKPEDFILLVEKYNIPYYEKKLGQLFCVGGSREITDMLKNECNKAGVEISVDCKVLKVSKTNLFEIESNKGTFICDSLVIATGGISIPKMGASDFGYRIADQFGIKLTGIFPALVPLVFKDEDKKDFGQLSGISIDSIVSTNKISFRENILFTHKGLSGPAMLQISSYWQLDSFISVNLLPEKNIFEILKVHLNSNAEIINFLSEHLPKRFVQLFFEKYFISKPLNQYSKKDLAFISEKLQNWIIHPLKTEGFDKAEVTLGGIDTNELSSKTMESIKVKGLYFIGEALDVTGWLGGYNFQWAWASGFVAGQHV